MLQSKDLMQAEWIRKQDHTYAACKRTTLEKKDIHRLKVKGWKQIFQANRQEKKRRSSNTRIRKNRLPTKGHRERPRGHFIILKGRIYQEDINIINIYAPNIGAPKYIRKILEDFQKDIDSNILIVGDLNTPLPIVDILLEKNQQEYCDIK